MRRVKIMRACVCKAHSPVYKKQLQDKLAKIRRVTEPYRRECHCFVERRIHERLERIEKKPEDQK